MCQTVEEVARALPEDKVYDLYPCFPALDSMNQLLAKKEVFLCRGHLCEQIAIPLQDGEPLFERYKAQKLMELEGYQPLRPAEDKQFKYYYLGQLFAKSLTGGTWSLEGVSSDWTVQRLLKALCDKIGNGEFPVVLTFAGKRLDPRRRLYHYNLQRESTVHIIDRMRGGMHHPSSGHDDFGDGQGHQLLVQCARGWVSVSVPYHLSLQEATQHVIDICGE